MKVPYNWLKEYVDIDMGVKEFSDGMTMSGSKVEAVEQKGKEISNVVTGRVISVEKHPNADKLQIVMVDTGNKTVQIVTGAVNMKEGDCVPVALHGASLPGGIKIKKTKLRGIESQGMMCSISELNLDRDDYPDACDDGIFILDECMDTGLDIKEVFGISEPVVEFEITPNRPDCLSILGIARETSVTFDLKLKKPVIDLKEEADEANRYAAVGIDAPELCSRYAARIIKDVKIESSPQWMKQRLRAAGVRPINNIVDITNYVMIELGQPMHAFNLELISGGRIDVRRANKGETLKTLDGQNRPLDASMLVIADNKGPVAVAGVMGGENSEITEDTKVILFESANFDSTSVRHTARKLGMRTEASSRFEKGLDPENALTAINRAAQLVEMLKAGRVCKGVIDCYPKKPEPWDIILKPENINSLLGTSINKKWMTNILKQLEFEVDEETLKVRVPVFRRDVEREADLAEEIARFYGYNNIRSSMISRKSIFSGRKTHEQKIEDRIKSIMISCGMSEIYTYSFTGPKVFDRLNLGEDDTLRNALRISNPLGEEYSIMRTTTLPEMLEVISTNYNRSIESVRLFEVAKVYLDGSISVKGLPEEKKILTIGMYGDEADFYELKGVIEELLDNIGIKKYDFIPEKDNPSFHMGRTAKLFTSGVEAGLMGEIHPEVCENFSVPERTYIGMFDMDVLIKNTGAVSKYKPLPRFPSVIRDVSMIVKDGILVKQIDDIIREKSGKILENIKLFDIYKGRQVPEGMKSVAYSITFRAQDRTLKDEEVSDTMEKIFTALKKDIGAQIRDNDEKPKDIV